jgi:multiple antibiotic resistance protein
MAPDPSLHQVALTAFATFFTTVSPFKAAPLFSALTRGFTPRARRVTALKGALIAAVILTLFGVWGDDLLRILGISLAALRVGGGILLLLLAIRIVMERTDADDDASPPDEASGGHIAVFPIAMPVIAGPASITGVVVLVSEHPDRVAAQAVILAMMVLVVMATLGLLLMAGVLERLLGHTGMSVIARIFGIILAALAAQLILEGIRGSGAFRG